MQRRMLVLSGLVWFAKEIVVVHSTDSDRSGSCVLVECFFFFVFGAEGR